MPDRNTLAARAAQLFPDNPSLQDKWLKAATYVAERGIWVLYHRSHVTWR